MDQNLYCGQIEAIRQRGGDVIVSFGGEAGRELACVEEDLSALQAAYQASLIAIILPGWTSTSKGRTWKKNPEANRRRNAALACAPGQRPWL